MRVSVSKGAAHIFQQGDDIRNRKRPFAYATDKTFPSDIRHRIEGKALRDSCGEQWNNVRVLQSRCELNLTGEPFRADLSSHLGRQHLYDHHPAEAALLGKEDSRHASAGKLALKQVSLADR